MLSTRASSVEELRRRLHALVSAAPAPHGLPEGWEPRFDEGSQVRAIRTAPLCPLQQLHAEAGTSVGQSVHFVNHRAQTALSSLADVERCAAVCADGRKAFPRALPTPPPSRAFNRNSP